MNYELINEKAVELLCRLIEVPRVSREETAAADLLQAYMQDELGLEVWRDGNNLWSVQPNVDAAKPTLLLNAHIDTVKPVAGWQRDPFKATREGSRIYGLGSNDDGASLVTLLHVFAALTTDAQRQEHSPKEGTGPYNLVFLASAEEEVSGKNGIESVLPSIQKMVNSKLSNGKWIDVALVGEPTGMQPAIAEKGLMVLDVTAHGKAGHAARNEGDNAIYHAIDDIQWFRQYQWEKVSPLLGPVKMSVTIVNAGTQHNVVPDVCTFTVDVRSNECYTNRELYDINCQHVRSEVKARSFRLGSSGIDASHPLVQRIIGLGGKPFGSPTLSDQALMPFPSLKMGEAPRAYFGSASRLSPKRLALISEAPRAYRRSALCLFWKRTRLLPFLLEESLHQLGTFVGHDAGGDLCARMKGLGSKARVAALLVGCAIDDAADLRPSEGSGTHHARLHRDVERAVVEVLAAQVLCRGGDGLHLGMGCDVVQQFGQVVTACDNLVAAHHYGSNRYLSLPIGCFCLGQSLLHVDVVVGHGCSGFL